MWHKNYFPDSSHEQLLEKVELNPGETVEQRLQQWVNERSVPSFCRWHPKVRLETSSWSHQPFTWQDGKKLSQSPTTWNLCENRWCPECLVGHARCPSEFHPTTLDGFNTSTLDRANFLRCAKDFLQQVTTHHCGFALFVGCNGLGKTRLACNILRESGYLDALFVRQGEIRDVLRSTYGQKHVVLYKSSDEPEDSPTPLQILQKVSFLILDELGCLPMGTDEVGFLDELLKHRYDTRKPTILIANLPLNATKSFLGDTLTERVRHASGNGRFIFQVNGQSWRRSDGENYLTNLSR